MDCLRKISYKFYGVGFQQKRWTYFAFNLRKRGSILSKALEKLIITYVILEYKKIQFIKKKNTFAKSYYFLWKRAALSRLYTPKFCRSISWNFPGNSGKILPKYNYFSRFLKNLWAVYRFWPNFARIPFAIFKHLVSADKIGVCKTSFSAIL